jgi:protein-disulfide isomerase
VSPTLDALKSTYGPDQIRIVWKHLPLPFHQRARATHDASATVFALGGSASFWKFYELVLQNQRDLTAENFLAWAVRSGVDQRAFDTALQARTYANKVDADLSLAQNLDVNGTPGFLINGVKVSGAQPIDKFKEVIDAELAEARKLSASGVKPADLYVTLTNKNFKRAEAAATKTSPVEEDGAVWNVPVFSDDPQRGPANALVTIVMWSDFECPFCKRVEVTLKEVLAKYPSDVRIVWKDNPLSFHQRAMPAAILARVAYQQKGATGFWKAHDALFESQPALADDDLKVVAEKVGLNWQGVKNAIAKRTHVPRLEQSMELASELQARGTPHFFINGVRLSGAQPIESFDKLIAERLAVAKETLAKGVARNRLYEELVKDGKTPPPPETKEIALPTTPAPFKGPANAKVVIQQWSDFQCPFCSRVNPILEELQREFGKQIKIVWRNMPLAFHRHAALAAEAAHEVFEQKGNLGFWSYHDKLFAAQGQEGGLERANLEAIAATLHVDMTKFREALDSRKHKARIDADMEAATKAGISGTPSFVVNNYALSGAQPVAAFRRLVRRALAPKKAP